MSVLKKPPKPVPGVFDPDAPYPSGWRARVREHHRLLRQAPTGPEWELVPAGEWITVMQNGAPLVTHLGFTAREIAAHQLGVQNDYVEVARLEKPT